MKILTSNYITCAVKACKSSTLSFPLHFKDAELVQEEVDFNAEFIINILPRIEWDALVVTAAEVCHPRLYSDEMREGSNWGCGRGEGWRKEKTKANIKGMK